MATREENLKKINDELEQLSDEQLEKVAGGTYDQTASDSIFLLNLGLLDKSYTPGELAFTPGTEKEQKVYDAFQKLGIGLTYHGGLIANGYYAGQQSLSQKEAWKLAEENAKKLKLGIYKD